jgi:hemoglobin
MHEFLGRLTLSSIAATLILFGAAAHPDKTLFEEIGGEAKLKRTVDELVEVMLADDRISFTFANTDIPKFKHLIYTQLCELASGPCIYDGRTMKAAHEKLPITNAMFNALTEDLYIAFDRTGVPYRVQNRMIALLAPMQKDIVKK